VISASTAARSQCFGQVQSQSQSGLKRPVWAALSRRSQAAAGALLLLPVEHRRQSGLSAFRKLHSSASLAPTIEPIEHRCARALAAAPAAVGRIQETTEQLKDAGDALHGDRARINMQEDYEVRYWTQKWNVSREQLAAAVREVGVMAADVARKLGKPAS